MAAEAIAEQLATLTGQSGASAAQIYAKWASVPEKGSLAQMVNTKLTANGKSTQIRNSLLATIRAGGAVGNSLGQCLLKSGLTGWS